MGGIYIIDSVFGERLVTRKFVKNNCKFGEPGSPKTEV